MSKFTLRKPRQADLEQVYRLGCDEQIMRYYGELPYTDMAQAQAELDWMMQLEPMGEGFRYTIADTEDQYIGNIGVFNYDIEHNKAELGFQLDKAYWNQGIMTQALNDVLSKAFEVKCLNRLEAHVDPRNLASEKVLIKCGFTFEGQLRDYAYEKGGYVDIRVFSRLAREHYVMNK